MPQIRPVLLTIDDDPQVLRAVERDLRQNQFLSSNFRIMRASSGEVALDLLPKFEARGESVAMFLVDYRMPHMDGMEFLKKAILEEPDARRVLLTAYADTDAAIKAINEVKLDYYLMKPWDPPEDKLYPVLEDLLKTWLAFWRPPYRGLRVIGTRYSPKSYELRDFLARNRVQYKWIDADGADHDEDAKKFLASLGDKLRSLPLAVFEDGEEISEPTPTQVAEKLNLSSTAAKLEHYDLMIVGGGPAGLASAVYGASEGLHTVVIEREAPGGQAGSSSRIENYLGFPGGVSGKELAARAVTQAKKFEAEILSPLEATSLRVQTPYKIVTFTNGTEISCGALIIASGLQWRKLDLPGLDRLQGAGVYYGGGLTEASTCKNEDVFIVGGANSAGQAAMHFSGYARQVVMLVRGKSLAATMSQYLIDQIAKTEKIRVETCSEVTEAHGAEHLEELSIMCHTTGNVDRVPAAALFIFIGAAPETSWLGDAVARDERGFILTGSQIPKDLLQKNFDRPPALLESSVPGIYAVGDVRQGSMKRVASSVGEGSIAVQFVHQYLSKS
jgi:thioredoxin reductase (NADPH)